MREVIRLNGKPVEVELTSDIARATEGADLCIFAIPTIYLRPTLERIAPVVRRQRSPALSLAKGVENETFLRPTEILSKLLDGESERRACALHCL